MFNPVEAKVKNNQLVVYTKGALERGIWLREAAGLQNATFRIDKERNNTFALRCVSTKGRGGEEVDTIAHFKTAEQADAALATISHALMHARQGLVANNAVVEARMPRWATISMLVLVPLTIFLLYVLNASAYGQLMRTFLSVYWSGQGAAGNMGQVEMAGPAGLPTAPTAMPQVSTLPAPLPTVDTTISGTPLPADAYLNSLSLEP